MDKIESWPFIQNFFESRTRGSYKVADILAVDHNDKLAVAPVPVAPAGLYAEWLPYFTSWKTAWDEWRSNTNEWHSCTRELENLLRTLLVSPGGDARSQLDDWETRISAEWPVTSTYYRHFFPAGRDEFTTGAREATIQAVASLRTRLLEKLGELQQEQASLQSQADVLLDNSQPLPPALQDALDTANARVTLVDRLALRINTAHTELLTARSRQQACEGAIAPATAAMEKQRQRLCRRLLINFHRLTAHYTDTESANPNPQYAAAGFFDLNVLMRPKSEDPPDDPPPPVTPPPPGP